MTKEEKMLLESMRSRATVGGKADPHEIGIMIGIIDKQSKDRINDLMSIRYDIPKALNLRFRPSGYTLKALLDKCEQLTRIIEKIKQFQ